MTLIIFVALQCQTSTIIRSLGMKYSMRDLTSNRYVDRKAKICTKSLMSALPSQSF